ncbi:uncharacterized protein RMCC_0569 [Mycolicibacterium canariasense]|uniref:Uncharacterized protein n=1 Tax=Mycolicibacterium canariasense TaxID=228230 RepID=A0A124E1G5_MYCCR|nr:hypothetical protein [Mycolicibacterium canariasense]MCV7213357.1 hypothetical protein [Mycolicibacterium canariasense]ORV10601.1 hypothetical protein AWB94_06765 [Mycolicibacterium canariasense]GAS93603.1 uncharacterized protein RMCC_0569 [Mycolicibacterium canariasense]
MGTATARVSLTRSQLDDVAWQFLRSEFTDDVYAHWPIDRRLDVFLLHRGYRQLHDDGSACSALLDRVMDNLPVAAQIGVLPVRNAGQSS